MKAFVYSLVCPIDLEPKYIGSTSRKNRPLYEHCCPSNIRRQSGKKREWLQGLYDAGLRPIVEIIHEAERGQIRHIEAQYTVIMRSLGFELFNVFDGVNHNERTKEWVKLGNKQRKLSELSRQKISEGNSKYVFELEDGTLILSMIKLSSITGLPISTIHYRLKNGCRISGVKSVRFKV